MKRKIDFKYHVIQLVDERVTVGYIPTETPEGLLVKIAAAWANPKDQFVKARGREIVAGRLDANRNVSSITIRNLKHPTKAEEYRNVESVIIQQVLETMPKAVVEAEERRTRKVLRLINS